MPKPSSTTIDLLQLNIRKLSDYSDSQSMVAKEKKQLVTLKKLVDRLQTTETKQSAKVDDLVQTRDKLTISLKRTDSLSVRQSLHSVKLRIRPTKEKLANIRRNLSESRNALRDQQKLLKSLEKREIARQKAVADFLKKWEAEYDKKTDFIVSRIRARKQLVK